MKSLFLQGLVGCTKDKDIGLNIENACESSCETLSPVLTPLFEIRKSGILHFYHNIKFVNFFNFFL